MKTLKNAVLGLSMLVLFTSAVALAEGGRVGNGKKSDEAPVTVTKEAPAATPAPTTAPKTESK